MRLNAETRTALAYQILREAKEQRQLAVNDLRRNMINDSSFNESVKDVSKTLMSLPEAIRNEFGVHSDDADLFEQVQNILIGVATSNLEDGLELKTSERLINEMILAERNCTSVEELKEKLTAFK